MINYCFAIVPILNKKLISHFIIYLCIKNNYNREKQLLYFYQIINFVLIYVFTIYLFRS